MTEQERLIEMLSDIERQVDMVKDVVRRGKLDSDVIRRSYGKILTLMGEAAHIIF